MSTATLYVEPQMTNERALEVIEQALNRDSHFSVYSSDTDKVEPMEPLRQAVVTLRNSFVELIPEYSRMCVAVIGADEMHTRLTAEKAQLERELQKANDRLVEHKQMNRTLNEANQRLTAENERLREKMLMAEGLVRGLIPDCQGAQAAQAVCAGGLAGMTEKLADADRETLSEIYEGCEALRIIDALTAENERLQQAVDALDTELASRETENERLRLLLGKVELERRDLSAALSRVRDLRDTHARQATGSVFSTALVEYIDEALANQPAAPRNPYVCEPDCESPRCPVKVWESENLG